MLRVLNLVALLIGKHHSWRRRTTAGPVAPCSRRQSTPCSWHLAPSVIASAKYWRLPHCTKSRFSWSSPPLVLMVNSSQNSSGHSPLAVRWILALAAPVLRNHAARQAVTCAQAQVSSGSLQMVRPDSECQETVLMLHDC